MSELLWHYTDTTGLIGMITEHKLRASSAAFMNDPEETRYALDVMRDALLDVDKIDKGEARAYFENGLMGGGDFGFEERFVACASSSGDGLELWRAYGGGTVSGTFAVGLDPDEPLAVLVRDDDHSRIDLSVTGPTGWTKVQYESKLHAAKRVGASLLADITTAVAASYQVDPEHDRSDRQVEIWRIVEDAWNELLATGKHKAYEAGDESRLSFRVAAMDAVHLRSSARGPVPYVELTGGPDWTVVTETSQLPIREVIAWPGAPIVALNGLAATLSKGRFTHNRQDTRFQQDSPQVRIRTSSVPFV